MLVRCPQCQYANQVEADATKPRIVCARCATVISIEFLSSPSVPLAAERTTSDLSSTLTTTSEFQAEEPSLEPPFMKTPESPLDLDSLLEPSVESSPVQPLVPPVVPSTPLMAEPPLENHWDADEILDIPRAAAANESHQDPLAVEDLLSTDSVEPPVYEEPIEPNLIAAAPTVESPVVSSDVWGSPIDGSVAIEDELPSSIAEPVLEPVASESYAEVISEQSGQPAPPSVFAQDSYTKSPSNTYVMATPDSENKGRLAKVFLVAALFFALIGIGYFALSGLIKNFFGGNKNQQVAASPSSTAPTATKPDASASTAPTGGAKTGVDANAKNATASPSATASIAPSATPATQTAASKPSATPAPAQTGTSGHAVGAGDGSLTIQLGAYKTSAEAQARVAKLKASGVEGRVVKAEVPGKGTWFRVQSGRFTTEGEASKHASELRAKGVAQDFIVTGYQNQ